MSSSSAFKTAATPEIAIAQLRAMYEDASQALRGALDDYIDRGVAPAAEKRAKFRYPELRVTYLAEGEQPYNRRAFAKFPSAGIYTTTVTHPKAFQSYLLEQLEPLVHEFGATIETGPGNQEIPYPYVFETGDELGRGNITAVELARHFPIPQLAAVGDEIADGLFEIKPGTPRPLALFDAPRMDYSLRRLVHYTGSDWRHVQPWILLIL